MILINIPSEHWWLLRDAEQAEKKKISTPPNELMKYDGIRCREINTTLTDTDKQIWSVFYLSHLNGFDVEI